MNAHLRSSLAFPGNIDFAKTTIAQDTRYDPAEGTASVLMAQWLALAEETSIANAQASKARALEDTAREQLNTFKRKHNLL
jgi:hypothetical protein